MSNWPPKPDAGDDDEYFFKHEGVCYTLGQNDRVARLLILLIKLGIPMKSRTWI